MNLKRVSILPAIISLLVMATFVFATPAWSKPNIKKQPLKDSSEKSVLDRDEKKSEGKGKTKVRKKVVKKAALGAAAGAAVGVARKKSTSGLKESVKDVAK